MDVKIKDRKLEVEYLRMALNMAEVGVDYPTTDLIIRVNERQQKLGGKFSIKDSVEIYHKWKEEWQNYFDIQRMDEKKKE